MALPRGQTNLANVAMSLAPPDFPEPFPTHEGAFSALQQWARDHGYAVTRHKPSNYANGLPRRYEIVCAFGGTPYTSKSIGIRKSTTRKTNCPFKVKLVQQRALGDLWAMTVMCGHHNHGPNDPVTFREHSRGRGQHVREVEAQSREAGATGLGIRTSLQANNPGLLVTERDVWNARNRRPHGAAESAPTAATTSQSGQPRPRPPKQAQNNDAAAAALAASIGTNIVALIDMRLAQYLSPPSGRPSEQFSLPSSDLSPLPISSHVAALVDMRLAQYLTPSASPSASSAQPPPQPAPQPPVQSPALPATSQAPETAPFQTNLIWQEPNLGPSAAQGAI